MPYQNLNVNQLESFLQQPDATVIDIRDIRSFVAGHIKNAIHIDGPTMGNLIRKRKNNPPILVYCYHGNSSRDMAGIISGMGFENVSHLVGGWDAWTKHFMQDSEEQGFDNELLDGAYA
jgi:thiosulfate sulfurtransferase